MPVHHACTSCGHDLTRIPARPDPFYRLPLVICPDCRTPAVRRRDPLITGFRTARKAVRAVLILFVQTALLIGTTAASVALIRDITEVAVDRHDKNPLLVFLTAPGELHRDAVGPDLAVSTLALLLVAGLTGAWMRSALAHLRPVPAWLSIVSLTTFFALLPAFVFYAWRALDIGGRPMGSWSLARVIPETLTACAMHAAFILAGFPFARTARNAWTAHKQNRWAKRRRARRRLRDDR